MYGQNKFNTDIMAISFVFWPFFCGGLYYALLRGGLKKHYIWAFCQYKGRGRVEGPNRVNSCIQKFLK